MRGAGQSATRPVSQDGEGRHYFVAFGRGRYRPVPCLPRNSVEANGLYRAAVAGESSEAKLVADYGPNVAFYRLAS